MRCIIFFPLPSTHDHTWLPSSLPKCLRHQLTHPRANLAKYHRLSNLLPASRPFLNSHNHNNNASYTRPAPTRDTSPAIPSPAAQPRPSTPNPRRCTRLSRLSVIAPTSRDKTPTALTTFLPRARPSCCLPEMCTSSPSLLRTASTLRGGIGSTEQYPKDLVFARHVCPPGPPAAVFVTYWGGLRLVFLSRGPPLGPGPPPTDLHLSPRVPHVVQLI